MSAKAELLCPKCHIPLEEREFGFWKCPLCDGEWWPPDQADPETLARQARGEFYESVRQIPLIKRRRSSRSGRRFKSKKLIRRRWQDLYLGA